MNLNLRDVIRTSKDGDAFWSVPELYIRGNTIKYLRVPEVIVDIVAEAQQARDSSVSCCQFQLSRASCLSSLHNLFLYGASSPARTISSSICLDSMIATLNVYEF
jgi:hypothetical protein